MIKLEKSSILHTYMGHLDKLGKASPFQSIHENRLKELSILLFTNKRENPSMTIDYDSCSIFSKASNTGQCSPCVVSHV